MQGVRRQTIFGNAARVGIIPLTPQPAPNQTVFAQVPSLGIVQVAQFNYLPAVVLTDGRIFANFNGSYEQVLRQCPAFSGVLPPNFTISTCWMVDQYGRYTVVQPR